MNKIKISIVKGRTGMQKKWIAKGTGLPWDYGLGMSPAAAHEDLLNRRLAGLVPGM